MPTVIETSNDIFAEHHRHTVSVREHWADPWQEIPHLYADWVEYACGPEIGRAQLWWKYGAGLRQGEAQYQEVPRTELVGWYVRVEIFAPLPDVGADSFLWIGKITDEQDRRDGALRSSEGDRLPSGEQVLIAYDMSIELSRVHIDSAIIQDALENESDPHAEREIGRAIGFNLGQGLSGDLVRGNATPADENENEIGVKGTKVFCANFEEAVKWNAADILEYLFAYFSPQEAQVDPQSTEEATIPFVLTGQRECLEWLEPELLVDGKTVLQVLNELVNRRRLAGYRIDVDERELTSSPVNVVLFSLAEVEIPLTTVTDGNAPTFPENPQQKSLDFDRAFDVLDSTVRRSAGHRYDQVVARGERMGSVITVSSQDETLVDDWTLDEEADYLVAASDEDGYDDLEGGEQQRENARAREDDRLQRVYSWFRIPTDWDGFVQKAVPLEAEEEINNAAFPQLDPETGEPIEEESRNFWPAGLRLEPRLPLLEHHTYSGISVSGDRLIVPTKNVPEGSIAEKLPPIVAIQTVAEDEEEEIEAEFELVDKLATHSMGDTDGEEQRASCHVRVQDHSPGIVLKVGQAGWQHMIAKKDFTPLETDDDGILDWAPPDGNLVATVFLRSDDHVTATHPPDDDEELLELPHVRTIVIDVPDAELIYAPPLTVVGVNKGALERTPDLGTWIRDDRARLTRIARLAYAWYGTERQILDLTYRQISGLFRVGDLITEIGDPEQVQTIETINTVITFVRIDLLNGTTQVKTQFSELDVLAF